MSKINYRVSTAPTANTADRTIRKKKKCLGYLVLPALLVIVCV
jgi:hypothetical protein